MYSYSLACVVTTGRRYYTCENVDDGECHVWKWWDIAVMEEMRATERHVLQLEEKVENLTLYSDYETDQRLARLEKNVSDIGKEHSKCRHGFEYFVGVMVVVIVLIGNGGYVKVNEDGVSVQLT